MPLSSPIKETGHLTIFRGNIAKDGSVVRQPSAFPPLKPCILFYLTISAHVSLSKRTDASIMSPLLIPDADWCL